MLLDWLIRRKESPRRNIALLAAAQNLQLLMTGD